MEPKEYWLISVPGEPTCEDTYNKLKETLAKYKTCTLYKFHVPTLNVGTLDKLFSAAEELSKLESEVVTPLLTKLVQNFVEIGNGPKSQLLQELRVQNQEMGTLEDYVFTFKWDDAKYPTRQPIREMYDLIRAQSATLEMDLATKLRSYGQIMAEHNAVEMKRKGTLATRYLGDFVTKDDFITDSEYLKTILVCVPTKHKDNWLNNYERMHHEIVPRSTALLAEDSEYALYSLVILKRSEKEITDIVRSRGFIPRDFEYDQTEIYQYRKELFQLYQEKQKPNLALMKWIKYSFSECFVAMVHIKAARIFIDSVLRFGFPPNFQSSLLVVPTKSVRKVREILQKLYCHLDSTVGPTKTEVVDHHSEEHYPYVYFKILAEIGSFYK